MDKKEITIDKKAREKIKKEILENISTEIKDEIANQVINDVKDKIEVEYKDELRQKISNEVVDDVKENIKKYQSKLLRRKSFKIFRMYIYVLALLGLSGFLIYKMYVGETLEIIDRFTTTTTTFSTTTTTTQPVKDLNWYKNQYGKLMEMIVISDPELVSGDYKIADMSAKDLLPMVYYSLDANSISVEDSIYSIEETYIQSGFARLFGNSVEYKAKSFKAGNLDFAYRKSSRSYIAIKSDNEEKPAQVINEIYDIVENENTLEFYCFVGYISGENLYDVSNINEPLSQYKEGMNISNYKEDLTKVRYTFIKQNDSYFINSIKQI